MGRRRVPIGVVLADDHALVRAGIRSLLAGIRDIRVLGEARDGRETVRMVDELRPQVLVLDISMPGLNGLDAAVAVQRRDPECRILVLSMHENSEYMARALQTGVQGYLIKDSAAGELELAIRTVARGELYVSRGLVAPKASEAQGLDLLTLRQRETLQLIGEGKTTKEIAAVLQVSVKTAETHRTQLMERLGIHDVAGLVRFAIRAGLVSLDR